MYAFLSGRIYSTCRKKKSKYVTDAITLTIPQKLLLPVQVQTSPNSGIDWRGIYNKLGASGSG